MSSKDDRTYGFSRADATELVRSIANSDEEFPEIKPRSGGGWRLLHCVSPAGGIAARSGQQMGSASCAVESCSATGLLSSAGTSVTVFNPSSSAIGASRKLIAGLNDAGLWVAIFEDCG